MTKELHDLLETNKILFNLSKIKYQVQETEEYSYAACRIVLDFRQRYKILRCIVPKLFLKAKNININITLSMNSLIRENILDLKDGLYRLFLAILEKEKLIQKIKSEDLLLKFSLMDIRETFASNLTINLKLEFDIPIKFKDIENTHNVELREKALRKFGYERYIEEGFKKELIVSVRTHNQTYEAIFDSLAKLDYFHHIVKKTQEECIITLNSGVAFLKVIDSSTGKIYFLKIPPGMMDIQEAKAWTFGLNKDEYKPIVEA